MGYAKEVKEKCKKKKAVTHMVDRRGRVYMEKVEGGKTVTKMVNKNDCVGDVLWMMGRWMMRSRILQQKVLTDWECEEGNFPTWELIEVREIADDREDEENQEVKMQSGEDGVPGGDGARFHQGDQGPDRKRGGETLCRGGR